MGLGAYITLNGLPIPELSDSDAVEYIEVYERLGETTYYNIRYAIDIADGDLPKLKEPMIGPGSDLAVIVPLESGLECLVQGPVFSQQIHLRHGGEGSWVDVKGADASIKMDREFKSQAWSNVSDSEAVMVILGSYALIPDVSNTQTRHLELKHSLVQRSSDLNFVRKLARRNGCYFWITTNALGIETAHFQRPNLLGTASIDLILNRENFNMDELKIQWDVERPTAVTGTQLDLSTKAPMTGIVPISPQQPLGTLNLQAITQDIRSTHVSSPVDDTGDLTTRSEATVLEADWFIRANCQTSIHRLGKVARAHTLANVIGAGSRHSGNYLIAGVRHRIDATAHTMDIELIRNGWEI